MTTWLASVDPQAFIEIADSETHEWPNLTVPAGRLLRIAAANRERPLLRFAGNRTVVLGDRSGLALEGLLIAGDAGGEIEIQPDGSSALAISHSTLVPGRCLLRVQDSGAECTLTLHRAITGPVLLPPATGECTADQSILDAGDAAGPVLTAATAVIRECTILGAVTVGTLELASDTLFTGAVLAGRRQQGCVRFSHVPPGSQTPRRFRCVPVADADALHVRPVFTDVGPGQPGYAQLSARAAPELRQGASDEGEMGAFHHLRQSQREAALRQALDEYLRFGREAGLWFAT